MNINLAYQPPGPVSAAFFKTQAFSSAIMGPVGSAKTSSALMRLLRHARLQDSGDDGVRHTRFGIIRDTYRNLDKTTIPSWFK